MVPAEEPVCEAAGGEVERLVAAAEEPPLTLAGTALLVLPFVLWGTSMVAMKQLLPPGDAADLDAGALSPLFVAAVRLLPSGALLVAFAAARGRALPASPAAWAAVALFGLVDGTAFQGCLAQGLERTSAGLGSVIIDTQPLTVAVLAALLFGERVAPRGVAGLLLGVVGLLVLEAGGAGGAPLPAAAGLWERGEWWMLLAAQSMAVGTVMVRWVCGTLKVDPIMATGWHMLLGGLPLAAASAAAEPALYARLATEGLPLADAARLAYASLLGGAVAYAAFFQAASTGSLVRLSSLTFLTPVVAAAAGFAVLGEELSLQQLAGAAITLAGISLVTQGSGGDA